MHWYTHRHIVYRSQDILSAFSVKIAYKKVGAVLQPETEVNDLLTSHSCRACRNHFGHGEAPLVRCVHTFPTHWSSTNMNLMHRDVFTCTQWVHNNSRSHLKASLFDFFLHVKVWQFWLLRILITVLRRIYLFYWFICNS